MPLPGTVLMLMPDEMRLRYSRRRLARTSVAALLALECEAASGATDVPVWRLPSVSGAVDLEAAMVRLPPGGVLPMEQPLARISFPPDLDKYRPGEDAPEYLLPALLRPAEKRAMDLLSGWSWLNLNDLAGLMGVSRPRASQIVASLEDFGLVVRTTASGRRLALTDPGLAMLSRRDRTAVGLARKRWSVSPLDEGCPPHWRNVSGRRSRQLLRHMEHTGAVHGCMAALAGQGSPHGMGNRTAGPTHQGLPLLPVLRWYALHPSRRLRPAAPGQRRLAFLPGVGATRCASLHHVGVPRPLSALLLLSPSHRRSRRTALRTGRLRKRSRPDPLPAIGEGGDAGDQGPGAPMGLP